MKISVSITDSDIRHYITTRLMRTLQLRNRLLRFLIVFFIIMTLIFWIVDNNPFVIIGCDLALVAILIASWFRFINSKLRDSNLKNLQTVELSPESFAYTSNGFTASTSWNELRDVKETERFVIFVFSKAEVPIAKSSFSTNNEYDEFVGLAKSKMSK